MIRLHNLFYTNEDQDDAISMGYNLEDLNDYILYFSENEE